MISNNYYKIKIKSFSFVVKKASREHENGCQCWPMRWMTCLSRSILYLRTLTKNILYQHLRQLVTTNSTHSKETDRTLLSYYFRDK